MLANLEAELQQWDQEGRPVPAADASLLRAMAGELNRQRLGKAGISAALVRQYREALQEARDGDRETRLDDNDRSEPGRQPGADPDAAGGPGGPIGLRAFRIASGASMGDSATA